MLIRWKRVFILHSSCARFSPSLIRFAAPSTYSSTRLYINAGCNICNQFRDNLFYLQIIRSNRIINCFQFSTLFRFLLRLLNFATVFYRFSFSLPVALAWHCYNFWLEHSQLIYRFKLILIPWISFVDLIVGGKRIFLWKKKQKNNATE